MKDYKRFLEAKKITTPATGFTGEFDLNPALFEFQKDIVRWALRRGRACVFASTGLGKTLMQLEWAKHVTEKTGGAVLILAPLAVASQTADEGARFGIDVSVVREASDIKTPIAIVTIAGRLPSP